MAEIKSKLFDFMPDGLEFPPILVPVLDIPNEIIAYNLADNMLESLGKLTKNSEKRIIDLSELIISKTKKKMKSGIFVKRNRLEIDSNELETGALYFFPCFGEEYAVQKLSDGKIKLFEVIQDE